MSVDVFIIAVVKMRGTLESNRGFIENGKGDCYENEKDDSNIDQYCDGSVPCRVWQPERAGQCIDGPGGQRGR